MTAFRVVFLRIKLSFLVKHMPSCCCYS